jgi:hypothetical protein
MVHHLTSISSSHNCDRVCALQPVLSATMFSAMVTKVAVNIAKNLETLLMRKRFTQLGSMQVRMCLCCARGCDGIRGPRLIQRIRGVLASVRA